MKLKPGKYIQRDGGIATVAAVDETRSGEKAALGWDADGEVWSWRINGRFVENQESRLDLIREYREPREWWIVGGGFNGELVSIFTDRATAIGYAAVFNGPKGVIHVREVIE